MKLALNARQLDLSKRLIIYSRHLRLAQAHEKPILCTRQTVNRSLDDLWKVVGG